MNLNWAPAKSRGWKEKLFNCFDLEKLLDSGPLLGSILVILTGGILGVAGLCSHPAFKDPASPGSDAAQSGQAGQPATCYRTSGSGQRRITHHAHRQSLASSKGFLRPWSTSYAEGAKS
jgi:hypothetical protein